MGKILVVSPLSRTPFSDASVWPLVMVPASRSISRTVLHSTAPAPPRARALAIQLSPNALLAAPQTTTVAEAPFSF
jgi:hypothetical protein